MPYIFYFIFGVAPSVIWLLFYLRKDTHPESAKMILKIFFYGMLVALPAILLEMGIIEAISNFSGVIPAALTPILTIFVGVALVEEFLKYLVVREKIFKSSEMDEPTDLMIYMIVSALGFAASENILILFSFGSAAMPERIVSISLFRFVGATFLHALVSGTLGYFVALSFCKAKNRIKLFALGLAIAVLLHGLYNFSIMEIEGSAFLIIPSFILIGLAIFITFGFQHLKKIKSVCTI